MLQRLTSLLVASVLTACASAPAPVRPAPAPAPPAVPEPPPPEPAAPAAVEPPPLPSAPPAPRNEVRRPTPLRQLIGLWEGEWEVDDYGFTGRAVVQIDRADARSVRGRSQMFDSPFGDVSEAFLSARFDSGRLQVKHSRNISYVLTLAGGETPPRLSGPFTVTTRNGMVITGRIRVTKR